MQRQGSRMWAPCACAWLGTSSAHAPNVHVHVHGAWREKVGLVHFFLFF
jgi:hypothetical protein